jgi:hypothetical protein
MTAMTGTDLIWVVVDGGKPITMADATRLPWATGHANLLIRCIQNGEARVVNGHHVRVLGHVDEVCLDCYAPTPDACECAHEGDDESYARVAGCTVVVSR